MRTRTMFCPGIVLVGLVVLGGRTGAQQPAPEQQPSFRSGVELVAVEVGVLDQQGRPIRNLGAADFTVTVGNEPRRVVTAEFIEAGAPRAPSTDPDPVPVSTNEGGGAGRQFVFVVDSNTLEIGDARHVARGAARFFSQLTIADRSSLVSLPIGRGIPFTWAHDRVQAELVRASTGGGGGSSANWEFGSLAEARDIATRGEMALREVALRECSTSVLSASSGFGAGATGPTSSGGGQSSQGGGGGGATGGGGTGEGTGSSGSRAPAGQAAAGGFGSADRCLRDLQSRAEMVWAMARATSLSSMTALRQLVTSLGRVQGDKVVVLISGGWPLEDGEQTSMISSLASEAAAARVTVFSLFVPRSAMSASHRSVSFFTPGSDQTLYLWPIENLASMTGGTAFRAEAGAEAIFERLARELSGFYRLGVEKTAMDTGASGRRMKVRVTKGAAIVRAREMFDIKTYEDRDWSARLASALESPAPATAVGLRVTSYVAADPDDPAVVRLVIAGGASRLQSGDGTLQVLVRDLDGRRVTAGEQRLTGLAANAAPFAANLRVPPGNYIVRLAVQDSAGRVGSVDHVVDARPVSLGDLSVTGPLLVQVPATQQGEPRFTLDAVRSDERLALEVGLQGDRAALAEADVTFEIAAGADGPALIHQPASLSSAGRGDAILAHAVADVRLLPPGQYVARARIASAGAPLGEVRRAFAVAGGPASVAGAAHGAAAGSTTVVPRAGVTAAALGGRAAAAARRFAVDDVLHPQVLGGFLDRVAARPDAASPAAGELLDRARTADLSQLQVTDAQAAQSPVAAFLRGLSLLAQKKLDPAAQAFRAAMRASADFYPAMVYLGACYAAAGNDKEAAAIWRTALIREGSAPALHLLLADALLRQGNGDLALQVVNAARSRWPDGHELTRRFVIASLAAGHTAAGLNALDQLVERRADDEPSLALALLVLYESLSSGRTIESPDQDRARMMHLAGVYRERGGPSIALVDAWVAAVKDP